MSGKASDDERWGPPWTVLKLLEWSTEFFEDRGLDSARLDAELMLAYTLGIDRVQLYVKFDQPLTPDELSTYRSYVKRRAAHEPVAYITGTRGFWTIDVRCDARALVPRPETEVLVECALDRIAEDAEITIVDVATGMGAVALAIASERSDVHLLATDVSSDALALAAENVEALDLSERIELFEGDLLEAVAPQRFPVDMIVANPPYVAESVRDELMPDVRDYEPAGALFAGEDGLDVIRRLVGQAHDRLIPGGWFLCEIGHDQGDVVRQLFEEAGFGEVYVRRDYGDRDRVVLGQA